MNQRWNQYNHPALPVREKRPSFFKEGMEGKRQKDKCNPGLVFGFLYFLSPPFQGGAIIVLRTMIGVVTLLNQSWCKNFQIPSPFVLVFIIEIKS